MKRALARRWAAALESGDYKQATGVLRDGDNAFCCLGVLCNLHAQDNPKLAAENGDSLEYFGADEFPPRLVWADWAEMKSEDGEHMGGDFDILSLAGLNDDGATFNDIAKVIRKHWKEL